MLTVADLGGSGFRDLSFQLRPGEILGFAGAEGNGQRDAIRALGGLAASRGVITCGGVQATILSPADALTAGILWVSATSRRSRCSLLSACARIDSAGAGRFRHRRPCFTGPQVGSGRHWPTN